MTRRLFQTVIALCAVAAVALHRPLTAAEITVLTSGGLTAALEQLTPQFQKETGHVIKLERASSMGGGADSIPSRLARGEPGDVLFMVTYALEDLIGKGMAAKDSKVDLADSLIGVAVIAGAPKPDISTLDAFKKTLLNAKSIAYSGSASGVYIETEMYKLLGLEEALRPKSKKIISTRIGDIVAKGEAEIGFQQVSELLPIKGIAYVGPLPPEVQKVTRYSAGLPVGSKEPVAARQLIDFVRSPSGRAAVIATGLEPLTGN